MITDVEQPVTRQTIEAKLREIRGEADTAARSAKPLVLAAGVVAAVVVVGAAYLLGRRRGRKRTTLVEIRRV
ncbi:MAG: hypothetical protein ACRD0N_06990 [Acidimicrobiales bacterium]